MPAEGTRESGVVQINSGHGGRHGASGCGSGTAAVLAWLCCVLAWLPPRAPLARRAGVQRASEDTASVPVQRLPLPRVRRRSALTRAAARCPGAALCGPVRAGRSPSNTGARRVTRLRVPPRAVARRASLRCRFYIHCRLKVASSASPRPPSESGGSNSAGPATWRTQRPGGRGAGRAGSSGCRGQSARQPGSQSVSPSVSHRLALQIPQVPGGGEVRSGGPRCARRRPSTAERRANTRRCWHVPPASAQPALCSPPAVCQSNAARVCERHCSRAHPPTGQPVAASREQLPALRITSSAGGGRVGMMRRGAALQ